MSEHTNIQWCDSSGNIEMGCAGCELVKGANEKEPKCYALHITIPKARAGLKGWPANFFTPTLFLERLPKILRWRDLTGTERPDKPWIPNELPRLIFLNDMGDSFSPGLPEDWLAEVLPALAASPHQFLILTKWPQTFAQFSERHPLPPNVWPGTTVTSEATAFRLRHLSQVIGGGPKWVSAEPLWGAVDWSRWPLPDWIIFGGESGKNAARCDVDWIMDGVLFCERNGIAPFVKQLGSRPIQRFASAMSDLHSLKDSHGGDWDEWPEELRVREFPRVVADSTHQPKITKGGDTDGHDQETRSHQERRQGRQEMLT